MELELAMTPTFTYNDEPFPYFDHEYNSTRYNERAVELPIALKFLDDHAGADVVGLEVGNVLGHYGFTGHRVVDLTEEAEGVENIDVFDIEGEHDWIVAISTLEHVRWDAEPREPEAALAALEHLLGLVKPDGNLLVTVPLGYHAPLDEAIKEGALDPAIDCVFIREGDGWVQRTRKTWRPYGLTTPWAEAVWIAQW